MRLKCLPVVVLATASLVLAACSSSSDATDPESETRSVTTPAGVTIDMPAEPTAALGFYTTDLDLLITLGFDLNQTQPIRDGYSAFPTFFPQEALAGLNTFANYPEFNLEAVLNAAPDFILNGLGYEDDLDGQLQDIAPTYTYNAFDGGDWRDVAGKAAADLGRQDQWQQWVDGYEARVADIRSRLDAANIDPVVAGVGFYDNQFQTACYGVPCLVFADLGLRIAPIAGATEEGLPRNQDAPPLSLEQMEQLDDIDIAFASVEESGETELRTNPTLINNPLWQALGFVANDKIVTYDLEMSYGSPSGQDAFLTVVESALLG